MNEPAVSVVVPTRDRLDRLGRCLAAIAALDYPAEKLEAVIADDGSAPLEPLLEPHRERLAIRVVKSEGSGPAAARNAGAAVAEGELLAFTDDDCEPEPGWLAPLVRRVAAEERTVAGGRTVNALVRNSWSAASQEITDAVYAHYNPDPERAGFLASNNIAVRASEFGEIGGFDPRFALAAGEDRDFCERWTESGGRLTYDSGAVVRHFHELDGPGFWRQHFGYGRGTYLQRRLRESRGRGFELAPAATSGILSSAARRAIADGHPARLAQLGVWQLANAAGFARQAIGERSKSRI